MARTPNTNGFEIPLLVSRRSLPRIHSLVFHCSSNPISRQNSIQCSNQFSGHMASQCLDNDRLWVNTNLYNVVLVRLVGWDTTDVCFWLLWWMICLPIVFLSLSLKEPIMSCVDWLKVKHGQMIQFCPQHYFSSGCLSWPVEFDFSL